MSVAAQVKGMGSVVFGVAILVGLLAIGITLITGAATFSVWVLQWTFPAFIITLLASVLVLTPLSVINATRRFSAVGFVIASFAFSALLWLWGMAYTYSVWGLFGVIVGLVLLGVGIVPVAMFAALVHGDWGSLGLFIATGILVVGFRVIASWLGQKLDKRAVKL